MEGEDDAEMDEDEEELLSSESLRDWVVRAFFSGVNEDMSAVER